MSLMLALLIAATSGPTPSPSAGRRVEARDGGMLSVTSDAGAWGIACTPAADGVGGCITCYSRTTGLAANWNANDHMRCTAVAC